MKKEEKLQIQVCQWLKLAYPRVIFMCDLASGMKMSIGQAVKAQKMRSSRGLPDLFIAEPRGVYSGLFIELKSKDAKVWRKDGNGLLSDQHIHEQYAILEQLKVRGYAAYFGQGFEDTTQKINAYLKLT